VQRIECSSGIERYLAAYRRRSLTIIGAHLVASGANKSRCYAEFIIRARTLRYACGTRAELRASARKNSPRLIEIRMRRGDLDCSEREREKTKERRKSLPFPNRLSLIAHHSSPRDTVATDDARGWKDSLARNGVSLSLAILENSSSLSLRTFERRVASEFRDAARREKETFTRIHSLPPAERDPLPRYMDNC